MTWANAIIYAGLHENFEVLKEHQESLGQSKMEVKMLEIILQYVVDGRVKKVCYRDEKSIIVCFLDKCWS
jgi:hypothetical protein